MSVSEYLVLLLIQGGQLGILCFIIFWLLCRLFLDNISKTESLNSPFQVDTRNLVVIHSYSGTIINKIDMIIVNEAHRLETVTLLGIILVFAKYT